MKFHVLSDIHAEFEDFDPPDTASDAVILAGDIDVGKGGLEWARERFARKPVFYVLGNHEYYGEAHPRHTLKLRRLAEGSSVRVLENAAAEIGEVVILGCTLWTDFRLFGDPRIAGYQAAHQMNDYRFIRRNPEYRRLTPLDTAGEHQKSLRWLAAEIEKNRGRKIVVVTHHAPSARSLSGDFADDILSAAFASALDDFVERSGATLWVHGHIHSCRDYALGGTRVLCNARGYPDEMGKGFAPDLTIDV